MSIRRARCCCRQHAHADGKVESNDNCDTGIRPFRGNPVTRKGIQHACRGHTANLHKQEGQGSQQSDKQGKASQSQQQRSDDRPTQPWLTLPRDMIKDMEDPTRKVALCEGVPPVRVEGSVDSTGYPAVEHDADDIEDDYKTN